MLCPLLYQILYQTVLFELSVNSCWFCPVRRETNSSEDLRSVWLPPGILEETQLGRLVDYERLRLKGSEIKKSYNGTKRKLVSRTALCISSYFGALFGTKVCDCEHYLFRDTSEQFSGTEHAEARGYS